MSAITQQLARVLGALLDSANLDLDTEARDCLEVFDEYGWHKKPEASEALFRALHRKWYETDITKNSRRSKKLVLVSSARDQHLYREEIESPMGEGLSALAI